MSHETDAGHDPWPFPPISFRIEPAKAVLLVIDMQYFDAHRDYGVGKALEKLAPGFTRYFFDRVEQVVVPGIQRLLEAFRAAKLRVVYLCLGSETEDLSDMPPTARARSRARELATGYPTLYPRSSLEWQILPELAPRPGEMVVNKTSLGAFNSTPLDFTLRNFGIETVVLTGVVTSVCVETTARDAVDRGYNGVLVDGACAAWDEASHQATLRAFRRYFGRAVTVDEVIGELRATARMGEHR